MSAGSASWMDRLLETCLDNKLVVLLLVGLGAVWGLYVSPFEGEIAGLPRDRVPVDAIPDTGDNQQIVFTEWAGRSPQDVEDQITYPLTVALLGLPGVRTVRSNSMFGFSSIFVIFHDDVEFYWSRSRIVEKLNSLPGGTLPEGVQPALGPDATPLGQVFWYTLEGVDPDGRVAGGFDLQELRSIQDWQVRYALQSVEGVAEVASIGGFVKEYQIDVDPDALRAQGVALEDVFQAVRRSNLDVGARTIEVNRVEYVVRGLGFLKGIEDIEDTVVKVIDNVPITIGHVSHVSMGPALRRGALDKGGAEAVGGVVVVRYGENPLAVIERVHQRIAEIRPGLPSKELPDGTVSQVRIVPFYDRTGLILETLGTLRSALRDEILVTIIVVLVMVSHVRSALLISGLLPLAVLLCFIAMKYLHVDANVVALSGIAIAIGTMVDMGVVICENILRHQREGEGPAERRRAILAATSEVGGAVLTAVLTTVVGFLPVFAMEGAEGKLFRPLAFTKTFALLASIVVALVVIPPVAHLLMPGRERRSRISRWRPTARLAQAVSLVMAAALAGVLARTWAPLGPDRATANLVFAVGTLGGLLLLFQLFLWAYEPILRWCLAHKVLFLTLPASLVVLALVIWLGFARVFAFLPDRLLAEPGPLAALARQFPGLGKEFMPSLDEGSFLLMPVTMPHASIGEAMDALQKQDMLIRSIPEVDTVVGKIGRAESPLDPAPVSMIETVITYRTEFVRDAAGELAYFAFDPESDAFRRDATGQLIPDRSGRPFRQWRDHIRTPDDIWTEIQQAARLPGLTTSSKLQPIETRRIMLQTGMRAPFGIKILGPDLETIEAVGLQLEKLLKQVPSVRAETVIADRIVGKPYLEIDIDRKAIARHGLQIQGVQDVIEVAIGGKRLTTTVEGRERYPVRVRYQRELRDQVEALDQILVRTAEGVPIPLGQLARIRSTRGPQSIKSEDTFLVGYVIFDRQGDVAEVDVVEECQRFLAQKQEEGELVLPAGVSYRFTGSYENQIRAVQKLRVVLPLALLLIFLLLYLQFRAVSTTLLVFGGVFVAGAGGFLMIWLYGQPWFLDMEVLGTHLRTLFQVDDVHLSVAVWVGFLALFGIATDDGVLIATYLGQSFRRERPADRQAVREAVVAAGKRRIRPCLMTTATTVLALIPVLTSAGRGSDVMVPMAIPSFGGMTVVMLSVFTVPVLYSALEERRLRKGSKGRPGPAGS